jgi:hypothetical protein
MEVASRSWSVVTGFDGVTVSFEGWEGFPILTVDDRTAIMSDTSVVQIYSASGASLPIRIERKVPLSHLITRP